MRQLIAATSLSLLLGFGSLAHAKDQTSKFSVSGWTCEGCAKKSKNALKQISGVKTVATDLEKKEIAVTFDDQKTSAATIEEAIKKLKFDCE